MKLFLLEPIFGDDGEVHKIWNPWFDKCFGMVVRAPDEKRAREIAAENAEQEGSNAWKVGYYSKCTELTGLDGDEGVVMRNVANA